MLVLEIFKNLFIIYGSLMSSLEESHDINPIRLISRKCGILVFLLLPSIICWQNQ